MPSSVVHVFVSSTWLDLRPERLAVEAALGRMRETKFAGMEYFGSRDEDTRTTSLDEVDRSQVYVGIIGGRYGSGITAAEYRRARERKLHCFVYLKDEDGLTPEARDADADKAGLLVELKEELRRDHIVTTFSSPADLAAKVTADLHRWLFDQFVASSIAPFQAPPLPEHFVPRPEVSRDLTGRLLAETTARPGVLVISAIQGMGGIGKSTLATALAHDPDVRARFRDGILWATLGQQPELLPLLGGWVQALGDYHFKPLGVEATSAHLRTLLQDRSALLVVDDAWDPAHVPPFLVGGPRCRVLVTTREATIAKATGAALYDLDVMTPEQSLALLAGRLGRFLERAERDQALALADAVGYLPLALELAAAQVADGISWDELLGDLRAEVARLETLQLSEDGAISEAMLKRLSLLGSFSLSLRRLPESRRRDFAWLGVLPEDVTLTPAMAATLWETDERAGRTTLRHLRDKALLLPGVPQPDGAPTYRLHDLLHDLSRRLLTAPAETSQSDGWVGLGLTLPDAHTSLLRRYRARAREGLWHTLLDDGYIHNYLAWHLDQAGRAEELHALLREETVEGRNGWYEARERLGQVAGYLEDVARAQRTAEGTHRDRQEPMAIGRQCRYALIIASLNSLAGNIPPTLLAALIEHRVWFPAQGLAYALQIPNADRRTVALALLAPHLSATERGRAVREALESTQAVVDEERRSGALSALAPRLVERDQVAEALEVARAIGDERSRAGALAALAPCLAELGQMAVAMEAARTIDDEERRSQALAALAPCLAELGRPQEALDVARAIGDLRRRAEALAALAPRLAPPQREQVLKETLKLTQAIGFEWSRAEALAAVAPRLAELGRVQEALEVARAIGFEWSRAEALAALAPRLAELGQVVVALEAARAIVDQGRKSQALAALAPRLAELGRPQDALEVVRVIGDRWRRQALAALAPHLTPPQRESVLREALQEARAISDRRSRADALAALAPSLVPLQRESALREALQEARAIGDGGKCSQALAALATRLAELGHPQEALEAARAIGVEFGVEWSRAEVLAALAPRLAELSHPQEAQEAARAIGDEKRRDQALDELARRLAELGRRQEAQEAARAIGDQQKQARALADLAFPKRERGPQEALKTVQEIRDERSRAEALAALAPRLPPPQRAQALDAALKAVQAIDDWWKRTEALAALAPCLADLGHLQEALEAVRAIGDSWIRAEGLTVLAPHLARPQRELVLREALQEARAIGDWWSRTEALAALAPCLAELGQIAMALETARAVVDEEKRSRVLAALAPRLAELGRPAEALEAAQSIGMEWSRAKALAALAPRLAPPQREQILREALEVARTIDTEWSRAEALAALAPRLAELLPVRLYPLWSETLRVLNNHRRADLLSDLGALVPVIVALGRAEAVTETIRAIQDVQRWWP